MQGMTPLELKFHLRDIERSFTACQPHGQAARDGQPSGWLRGLVTAVARRSAMALRHPLAAGRAKHTL